MTALEPIKTCKIDDPNKCVDCGDMLLKNFYGAGDGTGQKFRCGECYWYKRFIDLTRDIKESLKRHL